MKCPVCGSDNKSTYTTCYRCGANLKNPKAVPTAPNNTIWDRENKSDRRKRRTEQKKETIYLDDEVEQVYSSPDLINNGVDLPYNYEKLQGHITGQRIQAVLPPVPKKQKRSQRKVRINWGRFAIVFLGCVILLGGLAFGAYRLADFSIRRISENMAARQTAREEMSIPLVEKLLIDSREWHRITFFGKDDDIVFIEEPQRTLVIKNGKAELLLDDAGFVPQDTSANVNSVTVQLNAFMFDAQGNESRIYVEPYVIDVPLSPLKLISPQDTRVTTDANRITVKIKVTPGSRVLIGDNNVTDQVNSKGFVSSSVPIAPVGVNSVVISVDTPLHRINNFVLEVDRPVMDVPISLEDMVESTLDGAVTIRGAVAPGVSVSTTAELEGSLEQNPEDGTFSMTALLNKYGWNDIPITATAPDGRTSTLTQRIKHNAELESYSRKAWQMDFDYLSTAANLLIGRIYAFEGTVVRLIDDDTSTYVLMNVGTENEMKLLVIENDTGYTLEKGKRYKLFADVTGLYEDYALLTARFKYDRDPQPSETPESSPTPTD